MTSSPFRRYTVVRADTGFAATVHDRDHAKAARRAARGFLGMRGAPSYEVRPCGWAGATVTVPGRSVRVKPVPLWS